MTSNPATNSNSHVGRYGWTREAPGSTEFLAPEVLRLLAARNAKRVLDLGCGNGSLTNLLHVAGFATVGCDADAQGIALARTACPHVRFEVCDIAAPPPPGLGTFDTVLSTEVIEHLFSPAALLRFASEVLAPGGTLILSTPYHGYLKNLALSVLDKWDDHHTPLWEGGHIKFWSRRTLGALLEANGFRVRSFQGVGRVPGLWKCMIIVAERVN